MLIDANRCFSLEAIDSCGRFLLETMNSCGHFSLEAVNSPDQLYQTKVRVLVSCPSHMTNVRQQSVAGGVRRSVLVNPGTLAGGMDITPDLTFLNIHNPFTNGRISIYLDKHNRMSLETKDYFV